MDHLPNRYAQFYQYVLELFPLWIVVYFFHMQNDLGVSLISLFCLAIVAYAVSTLVFLKSGRPLIAFGPILAGGLAFCSVIIFCWCYSWPLFYSFGLNLI